MFDFMCEMWKMQQKAHDWLVQWIYLCIQNHKILYDKDIHDKDDNHNNDNEMIKPTILVIVIVIVVMTMPLLFISIL